MPLRGKIATANFEILVSVTNQISVTDHWPNIGENFFKYQFQK